MTLKQINELSALKKAKFNQIYIDEYNNKYIGLKDGRVRQTYSTQLIVKEATQVVPQIVDTSAGTNYYKEIESKKIILEDTNSININEVLSYISLKI